MKILFMGTPDFAAKSLEYLANSGMDIVGVISQPDRPKGRGHKLQPTDVKVEANKHNYSVYQPETLKDGAISELLDELSPDIIVVAAYGKILPEYVINYPKYGCINVHASILPKYRGAAPIQWAIINGEKETGVTIMQMAKGLDTGDILTVSKTPIGEYETAEELFSRLADLGGELLIKTLKMIERGEVELIKQDDSLSTYAKMIGKDDAKIDWTMPTQKIINLIYGMNSWPLAWTLYKGEVLKIATAYKSDGNGTPGQIAELNKSGLKVYTGDGAICIEVAQFFGSKKMKVYDYARGHSVEIGTVLGA